MEKRDLISREQIEKALSSTKGKAEKIVKDNKKMEEIISKVESKLKDIVGDNKEIQQLIDNVVLLVNMLKDYLTGRYKDISTSSLVVVVCGLLYLLNPIDLIPDVIPVIGLLDDVAVVAFVYMMIKEDINKYKLWKEIQD